VLRLLLTKIKQKKPSELVLQKTRKQRFSGNLPLSREKLKKDSQVVYNARHYFFVFLGYNR
jgi:hypothetical protein